MTHQLVSTLLGVLQAIQDRGNAVPSHAVQRKAMDLLGRPARMAPDLARVVHVAGSDDRTYAVALYLETWSPAMVADLAGLVVPGPEIVGAECPCRHRGELRPVGDESPVVCSHVLTALTLAASMDYQIQTKTEED